MCARPTRCVLRVSGRRLWALVRRTPNAHLAPPDVSARSVQPARHHRKSRPTCARCIGVAGPVSGPFPSALRRGILVVKLALRGLQGLRRQATRPLWKRQAAAQPALELASTPTTVVSRSVKHVMRVISECLPLLRKRRRGTPRATTTPVKDPLSCLQTPWWLRQNVWNVANTVRKVPAAPLIHAL